MKQFLTATILGLCFAAAASGQIIVLDNFNGGGSTGIIAGTSWADPGNVLFNGTSITVGNTAKNDNGWGYNGAAIDATSMTFLTIVARRESGNAAPSLVIAFDDNTFSNTRIFSMSTSSFVTGGTTFTTVQIPIGSWGALNPADIVSWTIGGGTAGLSAFGMTFDSLTLSAIPEPGAYAALAGILALGFAFWRRRAVSAK